MKEGGGEGGFTWSGSRSFYADHIEIEAGIKNRGYQQHYYALFA